MNRGLFTLTERSNYMNKPTYSYTKKLLLSTPHLSKVIGAGSS
jgi:hypothetical protein